MLCEGDTAMVTVTVQEMSNDLQGILRRVEAGEDVLVVDEGKPVVQMTAASPETRHRRKRAAPGFLKGQVWVSPDFDAPLPDDIRKAFE